MGGNRTVLISGAGIAGTTLAYWLRRHGFIPTVVERAALLRDGGYKVDVRGVALDVIDRMGLLADMQKARTEIRRASFVDAAGSVRASMDGDLFGGRAGEDIEVMRGDLSRMIYGRTQGDVEYILGDTVTGLTDGPDGVRVSFRHAAPRAFDLVVGADGLHSVTRNLAFGDESRFIRHLGHHVSIFSVPNHLGLDREEVTYPLPGRTALVYSTRQDTAAKAMFLFADPRQAYDRRDVRAQQALLAEAFHDAGWEVPRLLDAMRDAPDFYFDSISQVHLNRWSNGRVTLVGDAAYCASPASGQGTSLALVGAYVLAGELAAADGDHRAAFGRYEERMRGFVEQNQRLGPSNLKGMVMRSQGLIRFQLLMLRLLPHLPGRDRIAGRITENIHRAATAITLPTY
ncbi:MULTISPECIES: FAD-dependent monooxygenase [unclassified Micromonospora]|uniref:FAD-dependent monooxygenase n=1 Tax=unclassified Micromonospora TaxID=2617518 RepID=UPI0033228474